jgi:hypothetical protein
MPSFCMVSCLRKQLHFEIDVTMKGTAIQVFSHKDLKKHVGENHSKLIIMESQKARLFGATLRAYRSWSNEIEQVNACKLFEFLPK